MIRAYSRGLDAPATSSRACCLLSVVPVLASEKNICRRRQWWAGRGGGRRSVHDRYAHLALEHLLLCLPAVVLAGMCTCLLKRTDQHGLAETVNSPSPWHKHGSSSFLLASHHTMTDEQATVKRAARLLRAAIGRARAFRGLRGDELQIISENDTSGEIL